MMKGVNLRFTATNAASPVMRKVQNDIGGVQRTIRKQGPLMRSWNAGLNSNRRAVQQLGFQMSDFAIQIAGGQSAMLAFTQQGGQMLQFFGPAGSIMAAFLAIFGSLAIAFIKSGKALSDLFPLMGVLQDEFRVLGDVLSTVKELLLDFANLIVNNLDVILISASMVAGYFATKWVVGFVAARMATLSLGLQTVAMAGQTMGYVYAANAAVIATRLWTGALNILRVALIRLGLPAIIIYVGYLIERFLALSNAVGSFAEAFSMVKDVVQEAVDRMGMWIVIWVVRSEAATLRFEAFIKETFSAILQWMGTNFVNKFIGVFAGAGAAIKAYFGTLPEAFKNIGKLMIVGLVEAIEDRLTDMVKGINRMLTALKAPPIPLPDFSSIKPQLEDIPSAAAAAKDAFVDAFGRDYTGEWSENLDESAANARKLADIWTKAANDMSASARGPLESMEAIRKVLAEAAEMQVDVRDWFTGGGDDDDPSGGPTRQEKILEAVTSGVKKFSDALADAITGSKNLAEVFSNALKQMANNLISSGIQSLIMQAFGPLLTGMGGGKFGAIGSALFGGMFGGNFEGGGFTWSGARTGGLDGRGGRLAMLHPNETVTDHTKGGGGGMGGTIRVYVDDDMKLRAVFDERTSSHIRGMNEQMPDRIREINNDPYRTY